MGTYDAELAGGRARYTWGKLYTRYKMDDRQTARATGRENPKMSAAVASWAPGLVITRHARAHGVSQSGLSRALKRAGRVEINLPPGAPRGTPRPDLRKESEREIARLLHEQGFSWREVGRALGVSGQAAQQLA